MAKRKYKTEGEKRLDLVTNYANEMEYIKEEIIKPKVKDAIQEKIDKLRGQGYDDNRIAAMLMVNVHKVKKDK